MNKRSLLEKTPVWIKHIYTLAVVFVGWGLFAMEPIAADEMVIEYVGQNIRQVRLQPLT